MNTAVVAALLTLAPAAPEDRVLLDKIVASVNGDIITLGELEVAAAPFQRPGQDRKALLNDVIEQLVNDKLVDQQVTEAKISVSDPEIEAAIKDILRTNSLTEQQLMEALAARGMSMKAYKSDVKDQLVRLKLVDMKVRSKVVIPEDDLRAEYEIRTRGDVPMAKVRLSHFFLRFEKDADEASKDRVLARAAALRTRVTDGGEDFAEVARSDSEGPTASKGGTMGDFEEATLFPEFAKALKTMEAGDISAPLLTPSGIHVLRLEKRWMERAQSFDDLRNQIYQELFGKRVDEQMKLWIGELRRSSDVEIKL